MNQNKMKQDCLKLKKVILKIKLKNMKIYTSNLKRNLYKVLNSTILICAILFINSVSSQVIIINKILCENRINPIGIDVSSPRLSWILESAKRNTSQSAYQVQVYTSKTIDKNDLIWDSGKIVYNQSVHIHYKGPELISSKKLLLL